MLWWWNATKTPAAKSAWTYTAHSRFYCALLLMSQIAASNETKVSLCCSVCKHGDCLLCGKIREAINDSLRKDRNTKDLAGLPRVLLNSLVIYQNDSLCCLGSKKKKKKKKRPKKKKYSRLQSQRQWGTSVLVPYRLERDRAYTCLLAATEVTHYLCCYPTHRSLLLSCRP